MPTFLAPVLTEFAQKLFTAAGVPNEEASRVALSLVDSNLVGHDSHGVIRIPQYITALREGKLTTPAQWTVLNETPACLAVDGHWGLGQVLAYRLLEHLLPKVKALGVAAGTMRRSGHIGRLGEYGQWAAQHGLALFATVNSHGSGRRVSPPGGRAGRISTNPLCFAVPSTDPQTGDSHPLILDFSTSVVAEGKVRVHFQKGQPVPDGWLLDAEGQPTNDPAQLYAEKAGSIRPFGGSQEYKGFGLGLMMDIFAGALSGGECSRPDRPMPGLGNCVTMVLFDPQCFGGRETFLNNVHGLEEFIRSTPLAPQANEITLPGDPERRTFATRSQQGIEIPEGTWKLLTELATTLGVPTPA